MGTSGWQGGIRVGDADLGVDGREQVLKVVGHLVHLLRPRKEQGLQQKCGASQRKCPKANYNVGTKQGGGRCKWSVNECKRKVFQEKGSPYYVVAAVKSRKVE